MTGTAYRERGLPVTVLVRFRLPSKACPPSSCPSWLDEPTRAEAAVTAMPNAGNLDHWWLTPAASWNRLHAVPGGAVDPNDEEACERLRATELSLTALCGVTAVMAWPGIFSRLGLRRCARCCRILGIPRGFGTPGNEAARIARAE